MWGIGPSQMFVGPVSLYKQALRVGKQLNLSSQIVCTTPDRWLGSPIRTEWSTLCGSSQDSSWVSAMGMVEMLTGQMGMHKCVFEMRLMVGTAGTIWLLQGFFWGGTNVDHFSRYVMKTLNLNFSSVPTVEPSGIFWSLVWLGKCIAFKNFECLYYSNSESLQQYTALHFVHSVAHRQPGFGYRAALWQQFKAVPIKYVYEILYHMIKTSSWLQ